MTTLRQAVQEYLQMRRSLGFKLHDAGKGLVDFIRFMEQHRASHITQGLALAWAQLPSHAQPAHWAQRLTFVRGFARYRSATDPRTQRPVITPAINSSGSLTACRVDKTMSGGSLSASAL